MFHSCRRVRSVFGSNEGWRHVDGRGTRPGRKERYFPSRLNLPALSKRSSLCGKVSYGFPFHKFGSGREFCTCSCCCTMYMPSRQRKNPCVEEETSLNISRRRLSQEELIGSLPLLFLLSHKDYSCFRNEEYFSPLLRAKRGAFPPFPLPARGVGGGGVSRSALTRGISPTRLSNNLRGKTRPRNELRSRNRKQNIGVGRRGQKRGRGRGEKKWVFSLWCILAAGENGQRMKEKKMQQSKTFFTHPSWAVLLPLFSWGIGPAPLRPTLPPPPPPTQGTPLRSA